MFDLASVESQTLEEAFIPKTRALIEILGNMRDEVLILRGSTNSGQENAI